MGAQELEIPKHHRMLSTNFADDTRHGIRMAAAIERCAGVVDIDAFKRSRKSIGVALAANLAVGDDIKAGPFLIADREDGCVILRLFEKLRNHAPQIRRASARWKTAGVSRI